jgi:hypothetical protein
VTYREFIQATIKRWVDLQPSDLRMGQFFYNSLHDVRPDLAERVAGTDDDPFYLDSRLPEFCGAIAWWWDR